VSEWSNEMMIRRRAEPPRWKRRWHCTCGTIAGWLAQLLGPVMAGALFTISVVGQGGHARPT
jgi:hypothetical protein